MRVHLAIQPIAPSTSLFSGRDFLQVAAFDVSQAQARRLIERDMCVYRNRQGLICDINPTQWPDDTGAVWSVRMHVERDWCKRVMGSSS
jgi:hypothetical protein